MKDQYSITTAEVIRYLDSIDLPNTVRRLQETAAETRSQKDVSAADWAAKSLGIAIDFKTKSLKYRSELTPNQKALAIKILQRFANKPQLIDMDLYEAPVESRDEARDNLAKINREIAETEAILKETAESLREVESALEYAPYEKRDELYRELRRIQDKYDILQSKIATLKREAAKYSKFEDKAISLALLELDPFFVADKADLSKFIAEKRNWAESHGRDWTEVRMVDWVKAVALSFLSDYREQLNPKTLEEIQYLLPSEADRDPFFVKFTPQYIEFMLKVIDFGWATSVLQKTADISEFLKTGGAGVVGKGRRYRDSVAAWMKKVEKIQEKLENLSKDKLENLGDYIRSPQTVTQIAKETSVSDIINTAAGIKEYSIEEREAATRMIKFLRQLDPDRARWINDAGFSKPDSYRGHRLAEFDLIPNEWMPTAVFFCNKYRRQLPVSDLDILFNKEPTRTKKTQVKTQTQTTDIARYLSSCFM